MSFLSKHTVVFLVVIILVLGAGGIFLGVADYNKGFVPRKTIITHPASSSSSPSSPAGVSLDVVVPTTGFSTAATVGHLPIPSILKSEVDSPDGAMQLILQIQTNADSSVSYQLFDQKTDGENKTTIFNQVGAQGQFSISQNTWSPDNNYIFIQQHVNGNITWLVFNASGASFADGQQSVDVEALFTKKDTTNTILDVTGWDSNTLLHVFTQKADGSRGASFWFDVPSRSFIQLANY